jgi:hypothetical protein|tara:strand:+ start:261 stop:410 length:150 start_codon:yes stop_codon:yes gene_type:complete
VNLDLLTDEEFEELCRQLEIDYLKYYTGSGDVDYPPLDRNGKSVYKKDE